MFNLSEQLSDLRDSLITLALVVAAAVIGLGWGSIGLFNALKIWLGPVWGPVALGAGMIVPLIIYVVVKHLTKQEKKRRQAFMNQQAQAAYAQSSVVHISRIIDAFKGQSPVIASVAAVVAGILATRFPSLLSIISEAITAWAEDRARKREE